MNAERVCGCGDVMFLPWETERCERCMPLEALPSEAAAYRMMHKELLRVAALRSENARLQAEVEALQFDKGDLRAAMDLLSKPPALPASTLSGAIAYLRARHADLAASRAEAEGAKKIAFDLLATWDGTRHGDEFWTHRAKAINAAEAFFLRPLSRARSDGGTGTPHRCSPECRGESHDAIPGAKAGG